MPNPTTHHQPPQRTARQQPPQDRPPAPSRTRREAGLPRRRGALIAAAVVVLLVVAAVTTVLLTRARGGWQTVWSDDFTGAAGSPPSPDWIVDTGTSYPGGAPQWGTGELETYTNDRANVALDGSGNLRITPTRDASGAWRSARLETRREDFRPSAGGRLRVQARIRVPAGGPGYWAAFWMLGAPFRPSHTNWPGAGEIDVMENVGSEPGVVHGTLHCGVYGGGPCRETTGLGAPRPATGAAYSAAFHTYTVEWDRSTPVEQLRWDVDGQPYHTVRATDVDPATWQRATGHGFFLLLNVAVGGSWPGPPNASTAPDAAMLVDRVTVSRQG